LIAIGQAYMLRERWDGQLAGPYLTIAEANEGWTVINLSNGLRTWMSHDELSDSSLDPNGTSWYMLHERLF
jgi:hypothetical protein